MKNLALAALSAAALVASANAGYIADVISFTSLEQWQAAPSDPKLNLFPGHTAQFYTENFNGPGSFGAASISGGSGWASWTATASNGSLTSTGTSVQTANVGASLDFTFTEPFTMPLGGVRGIGGGFGFVDSFGNFVAGKIWLKLSTGDSIIKTISSEQAFVGFWVADPDQVITSIRVQPLGTAAASFRVNADTMYMGTVPGPGAIALLGAVGLVGSRRRRD
jgi:MYXO-CTERM domain-containing protein